MALKTHNWSGSAALDARGRRAERRIGEGGPGAGVVRVGHDARGLVASVGIDGHAPLAFDRDALGREVRRWSASGFRLDQAWDAVGQLRHQSAGRGPPDPDGLTAARAKAGPGTGAQRHYAWDRAEAPVGVDDLIWGATRYAYDANGQVAEARFGDGASERFSYDAAKNVAGVRVEGPAVGPGLDGLLAWRSTPGGVVQLARGPHGETIALTHDSCGRMVERRIERKGFRPKVWRYGWDGHDRLVRCDNPGGETWFTGYDPFGRRLTKVRQLSGPELSWTAQRFPGLVPASAREATQIWTWPEAPAGSDAADTRPPIVGTQFTWDGDVVAEEAPLRLDGGVDWDAATRWHYEPGGFVPLAKQTAGGELLPIVADHLGTPREMFDAGGGLRWAASYTTWGVVRGRRRMRGRRHDPRSAVVDTPSAKAIPVRGPRGFDAAKRGVGRERVALVDADGVWLALAVVAASTQDRDGPDALSAGKAAWPSLRVALLDGAFTAERCRDWCHLHGLRHRVIEQTPGQRGFVVVEKRWVVERTFGAHVHWGGLSRSRAGRLDVAAARLACVSALSGVETLTNPKQILKTAA